MTDKHLIETMKICCAGACDWSCNYDFDKHPECMESLLQDALELIQRQQKRIYHYECSTKNLIKEIMHLKNTMNAIIEQLEAEVESSDKYIREYDDSEFQKAWNEGLRNALEIVKDGATDDR